MFPTNRNIRENILIGFFVDTAPIIRWECIYIEIKLNFIFLYFLLPSKYIIFLIIKLINNKFEIWIFIQI